MAPLWLQEMKVFLNRFMEACWFLQHELSQQLADQNLSLSFFKVSSTANKTSQLYKPCSYYDPHTIHIIDVQLNQMLLVYLIPAPQVSL